MKTVKTIIVTLIKVVIAIVLGLFLSGMVSEITGFDRGKPFGWVTFALILFVYGIAELCTRSSAKRKTVKKPEPVKVPEAEPAPAVTAVPDSIPPASEEKPKEPDMDTAGELKNRMTGSLVACYKKTHDKKYSEEYLRRLKKIGFSDSEADNMFMFELMILKHDSIDVLSDPVYIYRSYFDLKTVPFPQDDEWYAEHQMFLMSEIVKIWDEAEYIWQRRRSEITDEKVAERIKSLGRYGGAKMFLSYMDMMSEKAHTDMRLLQAYARAEQDLLFLYKWKEPGSHPYL